MPDNEVGTRTRRGAETAARLRTAARAVFSAQGYAAARVEDIVAAAGVSHGTFYTYYDNKAAILQALVDEAADAVTVVASEPWEGDDLVATVEHVLSRFVDVFIGEADVIRTWLEAAVLEPDFGDRLREIRREYIERVADQLEPVTRGTDHDPRVAASALIAMVEGYATRTFEAAPEQERSAAIRTLAAIWAGGIRELSS
ncbi:MAG: TetR/AcrR family transcriptional regulator [Nitriliruptorales bacterium]|nr:TetR/AcrR family transcriptional regulator [Nitriliruptorales bacterium]